jgi:hypothetical protein
MAMSQRAPLAGGIAGSFETRGFALSVLGREALIAVARDLRPEGIPVMPLKGVLLQLLTYTDPAARLISDVDVLVPPAHFEAAVERLLRAGYRLIGVGRSGIEVALRSPLGITIDLHQRLFCAGRFRLSAAGVLRRARRDTRLGAPLWWPDGRDVLAHLIGKWVTDHRQADVERARDLAVAAAHYVLPAPVLAAHLERHGLTRAAHYVLPIACELTSDGRLRAVLTALGRSRRALFLAHLARVSFRHLPAALAPLPAHLLNANLASLPGAVSAAALARLATYRTRRALAAATSA